MKILEKIKSFFTSFLVYLNEYNKTVEKERIKSFLKKKFKKIEKNQKIKDEYYESIKKEIEKIDKIYSNINNIEIFKRDLNIKPEKINILIADDYKGIINLIKEDINYILYNQNLLYQNLDNELKEQVLDFQKKYKIFFDKLNFIYVETENAPYYILNNKDKLKYINLAILDIIYGGIVKIKGKSIILDGIDIAEEILYRNPQAFIVFYTGCSLHETSDETRRIKSLIDKYNYIKIIDKDINDNNRIQYFLEVFESFFKDLKNE